MLFNSIEYLLFFLAVLIVYWSVNHGARKLVLLGGSIIFYLSWSYLFLIHFVVVLAVNYPLFLWIYRRRSHLALVAAVVLNLLNLAFFKYFYFLLDTVTYFYQDPAWIAVAQRDADWFPDIILPLAISFYTFQILAMHIDAYRETIPEEPSFLNFTLFIMFFPQLIAGPICRHDQLLPKFDRVKDPERVDSVRGLGLIASGVIKKVVIADFLIETTVPVLSDPLSYSAVYMWLAVYFIFIYIYCDFSGYTDFARGSALLLGYNLPINFRGPMFALSFQEFWQRWHISLTAWLRDYVYIGLGGNRFGEVRTYFNLFLTFLLGGIWHGAGWGFAIWGGFHGAYLAFERFWYKSGIPKQRPSWGRREGEDDQTFYLRTAYNVFKNVTMIALMSLIGVFFPAGLDLELGVNMIKAMLGGGGSEHFAVTARHGLVWLTYLGLHLLEYNDYFPKKTPEGKYEPAAFVKPIYRYAMYWLPAAALLLFLYSSWKGGGDIPFVYFQF